MAKFKPLPIKEMLEYDPVGFASSFGLPKLAPWIEQQYKKGFTNKSDYDLIIKWVKEVNPSMTNYNFNTAFNAAQSYFDPFDGDFNKDAKIRNKNKVMDFENGSIWAVIDQQDVNSVVHRLGYNCIDDLNPVHKGIADGYMLIDTNGNIRCVLVHDGAGDKVLGPMGNVPDTHDELKALCVRKGFPIMHEAYSSNELEDAIIDNEIQIDNGTDIRSLMKRLTADQIINIGFLKYLSYAPLSTAYECYKRTNLDCLLKYLICACVVYNRINSNLYRACQKMLQTNKNVSQDLMNIDSNDTKEFIKQMEQAQKDISEL